MRTTVKILLLISLCTSIAYAASNKKETIGIDVSHRQGSIDWNAVKQDPQNIQFAYIKATEGATFVDDNFSYNVRKAHESGLLVGAYHFFRMTSSPEKQFKNFKKQLKGQTMDLIPMIDVETGDGYSRKQVQQNLKKFLNLIEKEYGKKPMIYGTMRSYNTFCAPEFNSYKSYIGRYGKEKPIIKGKGHYTIWQYTETAHIKGCNKPVDLCRFHKNSSLKDIML